MQPETSAYTDNDPHVGFRHSPRHSRDMQDLLQQYQGEPLEISFRTLVGVLPADESTHGIFPYPARLLRHIPRMLLSSRQVLSHVDYVIDPFCGSGTVLVEAQKRGIPALGMDQNPVAALVSRVKTTPLSSNELSLLLTDTMLKAKRSRTSKPPVEYLRKWYDPAVISALSRLSASTKQVDDPRYSDFLALVLAATARNLSYADPRIPVPVRRKGAGITTLSTDDVWRAWTKVGSAMALKLSRLPDTANEPLVVHGDSRESETWTSPLSGQRSLVITSPPYGAAQKYIRSTSLDAGWLGYSSNRGTIDLERASIGREHLTRAERQVNLELLRNLELASRLEDITKDHPLRGSIYGNYFLDMQRVFEQCASTPVNCERLVLICGTNIVRGELIETHELLSQMAESFGFRRTVSLRDPIRGRGLLTTRKSGAMPAPAEYVQIFERA